MELEAAKFFAAGIAAVGLIGAGVGVGILWGSYFQALARNPEAKKTIGASIWVGFAVTEAIGLFALLIALLALYG